MGHILTIASSKGGGGKTVLACLLAPAFAARGFRVGVLDADPNGSFSAWHTSYSGPAVRCEAEARDVQVVDTAQAWADQLDVVVIDTAGFGNLTAAAAMGAADHVLVPCMPDRGSTREAAKTVAKVASLARAARRAIGASVVLSQWKVGGLAEAAAMEDLKDYGIGSVIQTPIPDRAAFRKMSFDGKPIGGPLGQTVNQVLDELVALVGLARRGELREQKRLLKPVKKTKRPELA